MERSWIRDLVTALVIIAGTLLGLQVIPPAAPPLPVTPPDMPQPPTPPERKPDPLAAIARISSGGTGCSATVLGPRRSDGRWWVLTAAHCVQGKGQRWGMKFRDGRTEAATVVAFNKAADWAMLITESNSAADMPFALLAEKTPANGTKVWHAGYGVHNPGNREDGTITGGPNSNGQIRMSLSVSSGDSGGGIVVNENGEIVSCVCCTARRGVRADVWGASPEAIQKGLRVAVDLWEWSPIEVPIHTEE